MLAALVLLAQQNWHLGFQGVCPRVWAGALRADWQNRALGTLPGISAQSDSRGQGFESFWLGEARADRCTFLSQTSRPHNGYLETYLTLGLIGLSLLIGLFVATFWKIRLELFRNFEWGRYRLGFLAAVVLYNWTE
jgi:hypothetical protein